jgi:hypothetical protein
MFRGCVLVLAVVVFAACAPLPTAQLSPQLSPLPTPVSMPSGATGEIPAAAPSKAQATPRPGGPVIALIRSGGLAGKMMQWEIYPDGRIGASTGEIVTVPAAEVAKVVSEIENLGFFELAAPGGKTGKCADCFIYELTVRTDGRDRTLTFTPGASGTPPQLLQMLEKLNGLLEGLPKE